MPATKALNELRRSILILNGIIVVLLIVLGFTVFVDRHNDGERRKREASAVIDARIEICRQFNQGQATDREFQVQNILTLSVMSGKDKATVESDPRFAQYKQFVNDTHPYRQCSVACVTALYDPDIQDCAAASDEQGDP